MKTSTIWTGSIVILLMAAQPATAETPTPEALVARSIAYHDPGGVWTRGTVRIEVETTYSPELAAARGVEQSRVRISLSPSNETFEYAAERSGSLIEYSVIKGEGSTSVDGSAEISEQDRERLRIATPELYRDYCEYLYGMPMKLLDPGTRLAGAVETVDFNGVSAQVVRVTYDAEVGEDIWDFYFDPGTSALIGYRFFHDESVNDGEYILFDGEIQDDETGLRIPRTRAWYYNANDGHLATDDIVAINVTVPQE